MRRITIIGGGASGTLLAINLLREQADERVEINLVEKRPKVGGGVAFSTEQDVHLLNVPAAKMGAFADRIDHFHDWLTAKGYDYEHAAFVPRRIFGDYLRECLQTAYDERPENITLNIFDDEAIDVVVDGDKAQVILAGGDIIYSEKVALAFGNFLPPHPSVPDQAFTRSERYFQDPWSPGMYDSINADDSVLIIGTGLSMVDVTMQLNQLGHQGEINGISTRGLLPAVHKLGATYPTFAEELKGKERVTDMLKIVRHHAEKACRTGSDWRAVIDSLRPVTQELWLELPIVEKRLFMQHLSRYWNVARHRMPPEAAATMDELRGTGQLHILKGRLKSIEADAGGFDVIYSERGIAHEIRASVIINCIGSESRFDKLDTPLVQNLLHAGTIRPDSLNFGLDAEPDGRLRNRVGEASDVLHTLGTALKGILWESTAIPEIRIQARDLARRLLELEAVPA
jgi:uncharacterized NAD(P)/FAD-binding protein YdhS